MFSNIRGQATNSTVAGEEEGGDMLAVRQVLRVPLLAILVVFLAFPGFTAGEIPGGVAGEGLPGKEEP
jgi:hypothetical protein